MKILTALGLSAALLLSALAGAVIVGNATAEESKTYYACADKKTGVLRLVKLKTKCKAGETRVVWGDVTPTPTPTPTPRPIPRSTPAPTVTCDVSQSGTFGSGNDAIFVLGECTIPWSGLSRILYSGTMTVNVTGGFSQNPGEANLAPMLERYEHTTCYPGPGCLSIEARQVVLNQETCPASGSCTSTFNLVALASAMANDKVVMMVGGIAGASYSISGTYTISKE